MDFHNEEDISEISEILKVFLFQVVRELLLNIVKHAGVDQAEMRLSKTDDDICIEVIDHGRGFDPASLASSPTSTGLGLMGFHEKLNLMHGTMLIDSTPGRGSHFTLCIPSDFEERSARSRTPSPESNGSADLRDQRPAQQTSTSAEGIFSVLGVDDHQIMRSGLIRLLGEEPDIEIIGEAGSGLEAIEAVRKHQPDVIVMDLSMPGMGGVEATRRIHSAYPEIHIIGLSMYERSEFLSLMKDAGASDLLHKSGPPHLLFESIRKGRPNP